MKQLPISLEFQQFNRNQLESNNFEAYIEGVVTTFYDEIHICIKELLKLAEIDPAKIDEYNIDYWKHKVNNKGIFIEQMYDPSQPMKIFIQARYKQEFVVGYLIWLDEIVTLFHRERIDTVDERFRALLFLKGGDKYVSSQSSEGQTAEA